MKKNGSDGLNEEQRQAKDIKELTAHFEQIEKSYAEQNIPVGQIHVFKCPDGHITLAVDRHLGVTPTLIACPQIATDSSFGVSAENINRRRGEECGKLASYFGQEPTDGEVPDGLTLTHEFIRPKAEYVVKRIRKHDIINHLLQGGLVLRRIGDTDCRGAEPLYGADEMRVLTREDLMAGKDYAGGWSKEQLAILNVPWPAPRGWVGKVVGAEFPIVKINQFIREKRRR